MTAALRIKILDILQWMGFAMMFVALPFSNFFLSFGSFWLVGVWLLNIIHAGMTEGESIRGCFRFFRNHKALYAPTLIYLLPLTGLLWTEDMGFAAWDLRTKLPLLFMPFLVGMLRPMTKRQVDGLMLIFLLALTLSILICMGVYFGLSSRKILNIRDISIFISHIRLSMLLVFGIIIIVLKWFGVGVRIVPGAAMVLLFLAFLWLIESLTGFTLLVAWSFAALIKLSFSSVKMWMKTAFAIVVIGSAIGVAWYVYSSYQEYFTPKDEDITQLESLSPRGEPYAHYMENRQMENGHYIMSYICWNELGQAWKQRSSIPFDSLDLKGNEVKWTLIRYLTSLGVRKDQDGMEKLTDRDIENIERGIPSAHYLEKSGLQRRLDKVFFELDNYRNGGSPNGHSVFQRLEFWRTGLDIFESSLWLGVGTGDLKSSFTGQYEINNSPLDKKNQLRAHNQYLTFFITYGITGGLLFLVFFSYPVIFREVRSNGLYMSLWLIYALSFFTEDTLETQVGVTFYALFHPFLLRFMKS